MHHNFRNLLLALTLGFAPVLPGQTGDDLADYWRSSRNCGANCLYIMLQARGIDVTYDDVLAATPIGPKGTTLPELRRAAETLGVAASVGKGSSDELLRADFPVLVHMDPQNGDVRAPGHYVLVTGVDPARHEVHVFDGITALRQKMPLSMFRRSWSGVALEIQELDLSFWKLCITALASYLVLRLLGRRRREPRLVTTTPGAPALGARISPVFRNKEETC